MQTVSHVFIAVFDPQVHGISGVGGHEWRYALADAQAEYDGMLANPDHRGDKLALVSLKVEPPMIRDAHMIQMYVEEFDFPSNLDMLDEAPEGFVQVLAQREPTAKELA